MQIVSTAWIDTSLAEFELSVGLTLHAAHGRASAEAPLRVVILNGFEKVTPAYAEHLAAGHVLITDGSALLAPWIERLPAIGRRVNRYETLCLLRWLVLREAMQGSAFLHIDLDLFPQPSHAALASALAGRTGVLGSPCFVAVSDRDWLETWCAEIEAFGRDPEATEARLLPSPGQGRIGSDQTLLGSLAAGAHPVARRSRSPGHGLRRLRQSADAAVPGRGDAPGGEPPGGIDYLGDRPVLFWHMQNNFAQFVGQYLMIEAQLRERPHCPMPRLANPLFQRCPVPETMAFNALRQAIRNEHRRQILRGELTLERILAMKARVPTDYLARAVATRHFLLHGEARGMFSADQWWEAGLFA